MPLIAPTEYSPETFLADIALQRSARNRLIVQATALKEGLELEGNPLVKLKSKKFLHICAQWETLPQISTRYFNHPDKWRVIAEANGLEYPYAVVPGQELEIPANA